VAVKIRANDDHAVGRLRLEMKLKKPEPAAAEGDEPKPVIASSEQPAVSVQEWTTFAGTTTVLQDYVLSLPADKFPAGASVLVRAVAWDKRDIGDWGLDLKPQQGASGWHTIQIVAEEARSAAQLEQLDNLRTAIFRIMEKQIRARGKTAVVLQKTQLPEAAVLAGEIRTDQVEIQKLTNTLSASIKDTDQEDRRTIKRILNNLAFGDMLDAVGQCDEMVKLQALEGFPPAGGRLGTTQEKIVEVLRKLPDVTRQAQAETLAEMKKRAVGDLPNDTKQKLEEIRAKLEKFMAEQKKVIEASENLAKTPVEDFAEKEEQLLKTLAAQQDEWSKIMKDLHSDLSKLPEQDFANSSMAKELNEIQTELKMAEDALLKKSADIAVPLEQLGYERAEEITTNMEKWLPDRPDREKWSQEESPSDADKEAPMAELPGELEDLVGELMEEEEDLFDEMEDVSSSAADSIDKGAGWDVADGPISNMSAKGATGNRLPNTSEIGGRSGEGRSGKSSGEFVGDEAVGKDGRKTPARLTPDPYVKGQIKDHSKDPQGGASGGGKESGEGGEGLEGPAPGPKGPRDLHRLAGKQAALRNKAEGIDAQMQVMNYHHTDMEKLLGEMEEIERDLQAGRYQNALRKREIVLQSLASQKQYMEGEFQVKQDTTANLPTDVQKDILGGMQDPSPPGWEELVRGYYEQLATSGGAPPAAAAPAPAAPGQPAPAPAPQGQPAPAPQPPPPGN